MNRPEIVSRVKEALVKIVPTAKIILYGSEARGDARKDSDIDVLILLDQDSVSIADEMNIIDPIMDIEIETGIEISPFILAQKQWGILKTPFYSNVMKEGFVL